MIEFTKVHGNGNDFIVLDNREARRPTAELSRLAVLLCRRKFSIGADGILVVEKADGADFAMRIFNSDGSEGEMCGNGARAVARYAFEKKLAASDMRFMTPAGSIGARVDPPFAELDMGEVALPGSSGRISSHGREFPYVFLTAGVPHCVLLTRDWDALDAETKTSIGREISHDLSRFPEGANVSFAQALSGGSIRAVTYERGVEELTESCGTGCVAAAVAFASPAGGAASVTRVLNPGGVNEVRLSFDGGKTSCHAWLKGRTALVAEGRVLEDAFLEGEPS
ncbi:MAG: diaminopimelate epimerase [Synergistaceae bacterium]|jgi:diaminopimelate epimerase|nr:diaminopimelate epimerase [Synergistaceae bacterium]